MNISQIRTACRQAYEMGQRAGFRIREAPAIGRDFRQKLADLDDLAKPIDWFEAQRISDVEAVDEAFMAFTDDPTADNATCLVRDIIAAYLKG